MNSVEQLQAAALDVFGVAVHEAGEHHLGSH